MRKIEFKIDFHAEGDMALRLKYRFLTTTGEASFGCRSMNFRPIFGVAFLLSMRML